MWAFTESSDETHTASNGTIRFYDVSNYPNIVYEKKLYHNIGHCNTVCYNERNDSLLIGNLPGSDTYKGALYIIHNVSDWYNMDDGSYIDFNALNPIIIDLQDLKTPFGMAASTTITNVTACWGERNGDIDNIIYVSTTMNLYWAKILLGTGTNRFGYGTYTERQDGEYNGTFNVLKSSKFDNVFVASKEVTQGIDHVDGRIITANGHDGMFGSIWGWNSLGNIERTIIENTEYANDGSVVSGMSEGLSYSNGYVYQGVFLGTNETIKRLVRYKL